MQELYFSPFGKTSEASSQRSNASNRARPSHEAAHLCISENQRNHTDESLFLPRFTSSAL